MVPPLWVPGMAIDIGIFVIHPAVLGILKNGDINPNEWQSLNMGKQAMFWPITCLAMFGIQTIATNHEELKTAQGSSNFNLFTSPKLHITEHVFFTTIYVEFKHCRKITNHMGDLNGWMVFPFNMDQTLWFPGLEFRPLRKCPYTKKSSWPIFRYPVNDVVLVNSNHAQPISNVPSML